MAKGRQTNLSGTFLYPEAFRLMKDRRLRAGGSTTVQFLRTFPSELRGLYGDETCSNRPYDRHHWMVKYNIACGQIDIGNAATEMAMEWWKAYLRRTEQSAGTSDDSSIVGNAVLYMASLPLDANVQFMTVMATRYRSSVGVSINGTEGRVRRWHASPNKLQVPPRLRSGLCRVDGPSSDAAFFRGCMQ
jgi:hypothetical protein